MKKSDVMVKLEDACKKAYEYFNQIMDIKGIHEAFDMEEQWLFFGRNLPPDVVEYGSTSIVIDKQTGEGSFFVLSDPDNMALLKKAKKIEVPEEYGLKYHQ